MSKTRGETSDTTTSSEPVLEKEKLELDQLLIEQKVGVNSFLKNKYEVDAGRNWDKFYLRNQSNFFRDRHYIHREFQEIHDADGKNLLELGCGVGNTIFPLLIDEPLLHYYAMDFSPRAVELVQKRYQELQLDWCAIFQKERQIASGKCDGANGKVSKSKNMNGALPAEISLCTNVKELNLDSSVSLSSMPAETEIRANEGQQGPQKCLSSSMSTDSLTSAVSSSPLLSNSNSPLLSTSSPPPPCPSLSAFVCDIANEPYPSVLPLCDFITCLFCLSAIPATAFDNAVNKMYQQLNTGGILYFRDYAFYDLTQLRFKSSSKIDDKCYVRQDGTLSYFFTVQEVVELFKKAGFQVMQCEYHLKDVLNKKRDLIMKRVWIQGKFIKK